MASPSPERLSPNRYDTTRARLTVERFRVRRKSKPDRVTVGLALRADQKALLGDLAEALGLNGYSGVIREALDFWLAHSKRAGLAADLITAKQTAAPIPSSSAKRGRAMADLISSEHAEDTGQPVKRPRGRPRQNA